MYFVLLVSCESPGMGKSPVAMGLSGKKVSCAPCSLLFALSFFQNFLRSLMVIMTGLIVLVIPSFSTLMALVGATCCSLLAFIMPALFHLKIFGR